MRIAPIAAGMAAVLAAAAAWLYVEFRRDITAHEARVATGSRLVDTRCGPIELAEAGQGDPLLLVHGTGGGFDQAMLMGRDYVARGFRVIAPSRFGYLRTPYPSDPSPEAQADQFACLLDVLGVARVAIMGVSAGAHSAMQFAIRHPERTSALLLLVPAVYKPADVPSSAPKLSPLGEKALMTLVTADFPFWFTLRFAPDTALRMVLATPPEDYAAAGAAERQRADEVLAAILPISARRSGILNDARTSADPPRYALESIRAPTLAISVRDDLYGTYAAAQYTAQHVAGAQFIGFERGGHGWLGHHAEIIQRTTALMRAAGGAGTAPVQEGAVKLLSSTEVLNTAAVSAPGR
ncbi:MAG TPA: alpha/beta hydrolase [Burkholderiaceae bacterium]|nr:alpha/beta hydrolase [Burkholderiaceae bacterium]